MLYELSCKSNGVIIVARSRLYHVSDVRWQSSTWTFARLIRSSEMRKATISKSKIDKIGLSGKHKCMKMFRSLICASHPPSYRSGFQVNDIHRIISLDTATKIIRRPFSKHKNQMKTSPGTQISFRQLIAAFPNGAKKLFLECKSYYYHKHKDRSDTDGKSSRLESMRTRRQFEQYSNQLKSDLKKVLVPIFGWMMLPIFGNLFLLLPFVSPQTFLSRQFLTIQQYQSILSNRYKNQLRHFSKVADDCFISTLLLPTSTVGQHLSYNPRQQEKECDSSFLENCRMDAAGNTLVDSSNSENLMYIFSLFYPLSNRDEKQKQQKCKDKHLTIVKHFSYLKLLPHNQLSHLAFATGALKDQIFNYRPTFWMRYSLQQKALEIAKDDLLYIQEEEAAENHDPTNNNNFHLYAIIESMEQDQLLDACLLRGLPTNVTFQEMKECLQHHFHIIKHIQKNTKNSHVFIQSEAAQLFLLHLPSIRYSLTFNIKI